MDLGQFSLSLVVKDLEKSLKFYVLLGFEVIDGGHINEGFPDQEETKWRILRHESVVLGLFQGMFDTNILTFNPPNVRGIQQMLMENGVKILQDTDPDGTGPAHIIVEDPDGNQLMFDQF